MRTKAERMRRTQAYRRNREIAYQLNLSKYKALTCENCRLAPLRRNESGESTMSANLATVDHIIDLAKGGTNNLNNLQVLCFGCNNAKSNSPKNA